MSEKISSNTLLVNRISSILLMLLGILIWWQSGSFPNLEEGYPGPNLFPRMIAVGLGLIGIVLLITNNDSYKTNVESAVKHHPVRMSIGVFLIVLFPVLSPYIGFLPALFMLTFLIGLAFDIKWWKAILTALTTTAIVYLIFSQLLGVLL